MEGSRRLGSALLLGAITLLLAAAPSSLAARPREAARKKSGTCAPQKPQKFLVRSSYVVDNHVVGALHAKALKYRVAQYGRVEGVGTSDDHAKMASDFSRATTFFGHALRMHERVVPALACVEQEIKRACGKHPYKPQAVGGFRDYNSYRGGEVTNHLFGLAIDIDPEKNPCCRCVEPWPDHPACQGDHKTIYERMAMPRCWVDSFEKYGFYWLGHDRLQDTMHFEFLGRPDRIFK